MQILSHFVEFLKSFWDKAVPLVIVNDYEFGVLLRAGKFHKKVDPGTVVWKIPFWDNVLTEHNTITTMPTKSQSLVTLDGKNVVISAIVKYKVSNPKVFLLEVNDAKDAINDVIQGKIKQIVMRKTWEELILLKDEEIKDAVDTEVKTWGIKIYFITITDLAQIRTIRLMR